MLCPHLVRTLEQHAYDEKGRPEKGGVGMEDLSHAGDAAGYVIFRLARLAQYTAGNGHEPCRCAVAMAIGLSYTQEEIAAKKDDRPAQTGDDPSQPDGAWMAQCSGWEAMDAATEGTRFYRQNADVYFPAVGRRGY